MTENEAIEFMKRYLDAECYTDKCVNAHIIAINVLEEIQQYRAIGTVEECRAAIALRDYPTAYDLDEVVEQLEKLKSLVPVNRVLDDIVNDKPKELGMLIAYEKAIEIVK